MKTLSITLHIKRLHASCKEVANKRTGQTSEKPLLEKQIEKHAILAYWDDVLFIFWGMYGDA